MGCINSHPTGAKDAVPATRPETVATPQPSATAPSASAAESVESTPSRGGSQRNLNKPTPGSLSTKRSSLTQNVVVENTDRDIKDIYDMERQPTLGSGISGQVKICIHKTTKLKYALKSLSKKALKPDKLERLKEEVRCMAYLDHPNILRVNEYFETPEVIYLVMELCRGGELLDRLHAQRGHHYSEMKSCGYIHTMLSAIAYCHANNIVHRDLKLENFLFEDERPDSQLKLIDFGLSQYFTKNQIMHNAVGTPYYVAPEVLEGNYDARCDVWSIGVIAFMLLSGTPPFYGRTDADTLNSVRLGKWRFDDHLFKHITLQAKDFITKCLTRDYNKRMTAQEALEHPWFEMLKRSSKNNEMEVVPMESMKTVESLDTYVKRSSLAKIIMDVVAHTLLPEQIEDLRQEFRKFDVSNTGDITVADMREVLNKIGNFKEADMANMFKGVDVNETGKISYHEFLAATINRQHVREENLQIAFERMSNHNPTIIKEDIEELLGQSSFDVVKIMEEVGLSADAEITFEDFKLIMNGGSLEQSPYQLNRKKAAFWVNDLATKNVKNASSVVSASAVIVQGAS